MKLDWCFAKAMVLAGMFVAGIGCVAFVFLIIVSNLHAWFGTIIIWLLIAPGVLLLIVAADAIAEDCRKEKEKMP